MTHVPNPAEIEHVAGDVSKNGAEVNTNVYAELPPRYYLVGGVEKTWDQQQMCVFADATHALRAQQPAPATQQAGWTNADADAARLALELECLLMDTKDTAVVSKWWASANDALEMHRARLQEVQPSPTPQADSSQDEPLQAFDSPRAKALMRAWEEGWAACRDAEYVGEEAQNDAFNSSHTLTLCIAEDQQLTAPPADNQPAPVLDYPPLPRVGAIGYASVVDIESYAKTLTIGPHLPGVRDIALWTTDQMRAYADETVDAARKQGGKP